MADTHVTLTYQHSTTDLGFHTLTTLGIALAIAFRLRGDLKYSLIVEDPPWRENR